MKKVIGIRKRIEVQTSGEHGSSEETQYDIIFKEGKQLKMITAENHYGDCYSGWTSANYGEFSEIQNIKEIGTLHYVPKYKDMVINVIDEFFIISNYGNIAENNGYGGDNYYPSGKSWIYEDLFVETNRNSNKRHVYVFTGPSKIGKSHLAHSSSFKVYETDSNAKLPKDLNNYEIIVIGNKYPFSVAEVSTRIQNARIISCELSCFKD